MLENGLTIKVSLISSKDVRLPVQLQRAMAAEAEAAREARAKVRSMKYLNTFLRLTLTFFSYR